MPSEYLSLPLQLERVMKQAELPKCSLLESVKQHLHLLLTTGFGEFPGDASFGCGIWDHDFDSVSSVHKLKETIRLSLLQAIQQKEPRLGHPRVELTLTQEELPQAAGARRVKKRIDVTIYGTLLLTNERFPPHKYTFFVGPLSY